MRKILMLVAVLAIQAHVPARAEEPSLLDFMGGHGCTFAPANREAARAAGFQDAEIEALIQRALADGTARQEGEYVVLGEGVCSIRLPEITSPYSVTSPEIVAMTSTWDAETQDEYSGCFLEDPATAFDAMKGGEPGAGFFDYVNFIAAGVIAGELTFYGTSPLRLPPGFQVVTGDCANVPQIQGIRRSHQVLEAAFNLLIRRMSAENTCGPDAWSSANLEQMDALIRLQGGDPLNINGADQEANALIWLEIMMITIAAGWHEGVSGTSQGTPRPPLCHYP